MGNRFSPAHCCCGVECDLLDLDDAIADGEIMVDAAGWATLENSFDAVDGFALHLLPRLSGQYTAPLSAEYQLIDAGENVFAAWTYTDETINGDRRKSISITIGGQSNNHSESTFQPVPSSVTNARFFEHLVAVRGGFVLFDPLIYDRPRPGNTAINNNGDWRINDFVRGLPLTGATPTSNMRLRFRFVGDNAANLTLAIGANRLRVEEIDSDQCDSRAARNVDCPLPRECLVTEPNYATPRFDLSSLTGVPSLVYDDLSRDYGQCRSRSRAILDAAPQTAFQAFTDLPIRHNVILNDFIAGDLRFFTEYADQSQWFWYGVDGSTASDGSFGDFGNDPIPEFLGVFPRLTTEVIRTADPCRWRVEAELQIFGYGILGNFSQYNMVFEDPAGQSVPNGVTDQVQFPGVSGPATDNIYFRPVAIFEAVFAREVDKWSGIPPTVAFTSADVLPNTLQLNNRDSATVNPTSGPNQTQFITGVSFTREFSRFRNPPFFPRLHFSVTEFDWRDIAFAIAGEQSTGLPHP